MSETVKKIIYCWWKKNDPGNFLFIFDPESLKGSTLSAYPLALYNKESAVTRLLYHQEQTETVYSPGPNWGE